MKKYMKVGFEMRNSEWAELMMEKIRSNGTFTSGTYNHADPTHFEKGEANFTIEYGYTESQPDPETGDPGGMPQPEVVKAAYNDCTWGVDFSFVTSVGTITGYFNRPNTSRETGEWTIEHPLLFWRVFKNILTEIGESTYNRRSAAAELSRYE